MYHTPRGERILYGAERRFFTQSLAMIVDLLAEGDVELGIAPFDELQRNQKLVVLCNSARALLRPREMPPKLTAFIESAVATVTGKHGQAFIHIATYTGHVNLGFNQGARLDDPEDLLEGTGKMIRHVRLNLKSQLQSKPVKELIANAVGLAREMAEAKGGIQPARVGIRIVKKNKGGR